MGKFGMDFNSFRWFEVMYRVISIYLFVIDINIMLF